jgi:hypothetical protein
MRQILNFVQGSSSTGSTAVLVCVIVYRPFIHNKTGKTITRTTTTDEAVFDLKR